MALNLTLGSLMKEVSQLYILYRIRLLAFKILTLICITFKKVYLKKIILKSILLKKLAHL